MSTTPQQDASINKLNEIIANYDSDMAKKADTDGVYPDLIAGDLYSNISTTNSDPYLFRKAPDGTRATLSHLTGASVGWNQLLYATAPTTATVNDVTFTVNADHSIKVSGTASAQADFNIGRIDYIKDHKYLILGVPSSASASTHCLFAFSATQIKDTILSPTATDYANTRIRVFNGQSGGDAVYRPLIIDLTLMFGSAIADEAYAKEQSVAGSGIAWLKSAGFFTKPYYPYDAGSIVSVNTEGRKVVGFNQWDEEWELGTIANATGADYPSTTAIRSGYIPVLPSTAYHMTYDSAVSTTDAIFFYDANKNHIAPRKEFTHGTTISVDFTTPANAQFIRFKLNSTTTYESGLCINISSSRNGEYEPYTSQTYPIPSTDLRGITKLTDGKITYDGDTFLPNGTINRKYGYIKFVGAADEEWTKTANYGTVSRFDYNSIVGKAHADCISNLFPKGLGGVADTESVSFHGADGHLIIQILTSKLSADTAAGLKAYLAQHNLEVVYELATPTTEDGGEWTETQLNYVGGTEEFLDDRSVPMPVSADEKVMASLKAPLESIVGALPSADGTYSLKVVMANGTPTFTWSV